MSELGAELRILSCKWGYNLSMLGDYWYHQFAFGISKSETASFITFSL
jgi:hypothetical protein